MSTVIRLERVGKKYRLRHQNIAHYKALRDVFSETLRGFGSRLVTPGRQKQVTKEDFWALRDISFEVKQGERLGIIGRNGAGKSTLLKLLGRITAPSEGRILLKGRVGSLLEVGTGFHPELTGRENIFLNSAILGMSRIDIRRKFDEIVAFAEVDKFLDTPVKRYSSGMYVRLAFAVAVHIDLDVLLVDEVLAVGDMAFQRKCIEQMKSISRNKGITILFVSHNMSIITSFCTQAILLYSGRIQTIGPVRDVIQTYSTEIHNLAIADLSIMTHNGPQEYIRTEQLALFDSTMAPSTTFSMGQSLIARISLRCHKKMLGAEIGLKISSISGIAIHYFSSSWEGLKPNLEPGTYIFEVNVPEIMLLPGKYILGIWVLRDGFWSDDNVQEISTIEVIGRDVSGNFKKQGIQNTFEKYAYSGCEVYAPSRWKIIKENHENER